MAGRPVSTPTSHPCGCSVKYLTELEGRLEHRRPICVRRHVEHGDKVQLVR